MTAFLHEHRDFAGLILIVAEKRGLDPALVEKDYWVTHSLWALQAGGFDLWFKGGTSLSKGFGLIERFSEDLDLRVDPGTVPGAPPVSDWKRGGTNRVKQRSAYFQFLGERIAVPSARIEMEKRRIDGSARSADYRVLYPGQFLGGLGPPFSPYVRLEVGRARVEPCVERDIGSFVQDHCEAEGMLADFRDNRPRRLRCVHPLVTLVDKIEAIARGYRREPFDPHRFVRHYEDAARIIAAEAALPPAGMSPADLLYAMVSDRDIAEAPRADAQALALPDADRKDRLLAAHAAIGPMFWGPRRSLEESAAAIRGWLDRL